MENVYVLYESGMAFFRTEYISVKTSCIRKHLQNYITIHMENICFLQLSYRAREIFSKFLCSKATTPVNIDSQAQLADDILNSPHPDMFKEQQLQVTTESRTFVHLCLLSFHVKCCEMSKTIFSC